ncbi:MAG TPA: metallophosphoesterase family protein [Tenuifilaceae bacterium]|nr:metallophosphoesterase family protein [Tenuifilaceae bacterium]
MNKYFIVVFGWLTLFGCNSFQQNNRLHFDKNGEFKIVQFTDMHLQDNIADTVFASAEKIINIEKPNLVVITGDVTYQDSVKKLIHKLATIFANKKLPWAVVLGNHDDEFGTSRKTLSQIYRSQPYNLNVKTKGVHGETNFILPISGKNGENEALLYFFDSNAYNPLKGKVDGAYAWIDFSQISWYRNQSIKYTKKNNGVPVPALAFFHIPLPEYKTLWQQDSASCIGSKHEDVCSPLVNSGMYVSMLEQGNIMGTFVGHDHVNDYIGVLNGIALAYGRFSGTKNIYGFLTPGARVIILKEDKREFETWIRDKSGKVSYKCQYPNSFKKDQEK